MITRVADVGGVTIVDDAKVSEPDLGNNFFVDETHLGKSRAEVRFFLPCQHVLC